MYFVGVKQLPRTCRKKKATTQVTASQPEAEGSQVLGRAAATEPPIFRPQTRHHHQQDLQPLRVDLVEVDSSPVQSALHVTQTPYLRELPHYQL
jgi:hypothetical protein